MTLSALPAPAPAIEDLEPYVSARMLHGFEAEGIFLDANEMPLAPHLAPPDLNAINHYADDTPIALTQAYAAHAGVPEGCVLATRGIDEGVELLIRAYCEPGADQILVLPPTYGMYAVSAATHRTAVLRLPLLNLTDLDLRGLDRLAPWPKVIFLCRPNNPTGHVMARAAVEAVLERAAGRSIVAVDEAYIEFCAGETLVPLLRDHPNLVVLRTLSKAFGLAGLHVGFTLGAQPLIDVLKRIVNPYPIPDPCARLALAALTPEASTAREALIAAMLATRERFAARLARHPACRHLLPSAANYVLGRFDGADEIIGALGRHKIYIRPLAADLPGPGWLRFTIGTRTQMDRVADVLDLPA